MNAPAPSLSSRCLAEALGTFILVFFGTGAVHVAVLAGGLVGLWQVGVVWALAIMLAIYLVGGISGAHINPAITVALSTWGKFPPRLVAPYILSQVVGAFVASAVLYTLFAPYLAGLESSKQVTRGQPGSEITAMCYGEYFPDPGGMARNDAKGSALVQELALSESLVSPAAAFAAETVGTFLLALVVFGLTDPRNASAPPPGLVAPAIGLTVAALICVIAPLTQACFNPARDFGPRLFAYFAGWGSVAIPGPRGAGFLTVYIAAPIAGAVLAGGFHTLVLGPRLGSATIPEEASS